LELSGTSQVATFLQSDVLQAIALSLAIPLVILPLTRDRRTVGLVSLGLAIAIAFATPLVWAADLGGLPLPLATLFTPALGSPFPLLPWTSFVLCGVVAGAIFLDVRRTGDEMRLTATIANVFCAGLALVLAGPVLDSHIVDLYPSSAFDGGTPGFFAIRLGLVLMAFAALALSMGATRAGSSTLRLLQVVGQQSLLIYCLGLFLLFGWVLDVPRLAQVVGHTLGFIECLALFAALSAVTVAVGCSWHMYSRSFRAQARAIQYAIAGIFVWLFLIRPY
jgi:hypothetical protein